MKFLIIFATSAILLQYFSPATSSGQGGNEHSSSGSESRLPKDVGKYKFLENVGGGHFAKVFLAKHEPTGVEVTIKILSKSRLNNEQKEKLQKEATIMKGLVHPNIVELYQVINTDRKLYIVMEDASGGDVGDYLDDLSDGIMKEDEARAKFRQMVLAVRYLHQMDIVHRDLKLDNILLDSERINIKVGDFGLSGRISSKSKAVDFVPGFTAPEVLLGGVFGPEADVWSLGVILHEIIGDSQPFEGEDKDEVLESINEGYSAPDVSKECQELLRSIFVADPNKRITLEAIMQHKWLKKDDNKPHTQPKPIADQKQIEKKLTDLKHTMEVIKKSIEEENYEDDLFATYLILGGKSKKAHSGGSASQSQKRGPTSGNSPPGKK